jgi:hypothetical protein
LDNTDSLIANYIYQDFLTKQILDFQQQEQKKLILKMQPIKHQHLIAAASQNFIKQYQEYLQEPLSMVILLTITDAMRKKPLWLFDG